MTSTVVWDGEAHLPTVLVFDPAPPAAPPELPRPWRELVDRRQVVWCRFGEPQALAEIDRLLGDADAFGRPIDVVVQGGPADVVDVLRRHAGPLRAVVAVDAEPDAIGDLGDVRIVAVGTPSTPPRAVAGEAVHTDVATALDALDADDLNERVSSANETGSTEGKGEGS